MENNIHYLHGVIDTLKDIIINNTNIKLSNIHTNILKKENIINNQIIVDENNQITFDNQIDNNIDNNIDHNHIEKIDTAKNYIVLLEQMCKNRIKLLYKIEINEYIDILQKNIIDTTEKLKQRGLDDKKIKNLIKNKFLKSFETKFLLQYKYEDISLTNDDILFLQDASKRRYNYDKYKIFVKESFLNHFLNYTISIFDISDMILLIIQNKFCNLKYIPQSRSKPEDPYSFYYLDKIENDKLYWKMDCRLDFISNYIRENILQYCIDLFKNIYYQIFHDFTYRSNFETEKDILQFEGIQLLKNIYKLCNSYNFTKLFQLLFINHNQSNSPDEEKFKLNLKMDDTSQKTMYKELKHNTNIKCDFSSTLETIFTEINDDNINEISAKII